MLGNCWRQSICWSKPKQHGILDHIVICILRHRFIPGVEFTRHQNFQANFTRIPARILAVMVLRISWPNHSLLYLWPTLVLCKKLIKFLVVYAVSGAPWAKTVAHTNTCGNTRIYYRYVAANKHYLRHYHVSRTPLPCWLRGRANGSCGLLNAAVLHEATLHSFYRNGNLRSLYKPQNLVSCYWLPILECGQALWPWERSVYVITALTAAVTAFEPLHQVYF